MFLANSSDDIDNSQMLQLAELDEDWLDAKLQKIPHELARNMISQLLAFDPAQRPSMEQIMDHPFISGGSAGRLLGQSAAYDVFISYRVASDSANASLLYDLLTAQGLKVWWDQKCLLAGEDW